MNIQQWLATLSDEALAHAEDAIHQEQRKRVRPAVPFDVSMDLEIDREIRDLEACWGQEDDDRTRRAAEAQREHLEMRRARLRSGEWKPRHRCPQCLRAILTMDPSLVCEYAKKDGDQWWARL